MLAGMRAASGMEKAKAPVAPTETAKTASPVPAEGCTAAASPAREHTVCM